MTVYGWDASHYDWSRGPMELDKARAAGISLFTHKVTEGKPDWFVDRKAREAFQRASAAHFPVLGGYHVLHPEDMGGTVEAQIDFYLGRLHTVFPGWRDHPCFVHQIDAEVFDYMTHEPSIVEVNRAADHILARTGCARTQIPIYAPQWLYGDRLGNLRYPIWWESDYGNNPVGRFKRVYPGDGSSRWAASATGAPTILQFGSQTTIGTQPTCDADAIRVASEDDLIALFLGEDMPTAEEIAKAVARADIYTAPGWAEDKKANPTWTLERYVRETSEDAHNALLDAAAAKRQTDTLEAALKAARQDIDALQAKVDQLLANLPTIGGTVHVNVTGDLPVT
jgi:hypothetical protein